MIPRIKEIKPLNNYKLFVTFEDGKSGVYNVLDDIKQLPTFEALQSIKGLFERVQVDKSRTCAYWTDLIDLPSDAIYENLKE